MAPKVKVAAGGAAEPNENWGEGQQGCVRRRAE